MNVRLSNQFLLISLLAIAGACALGCRNMNVNDKPAVGLVLPKAKMEKDSVAVRVAVAELDENQQSAFRSFIETTDFQKIPLETRKRLDDNGFRVSVVSSVNSPQVQDLLAPLVPKEDWLTAEEKELYEAGKLASIRRLKSHRHVERKRGKSFNVELSPVMDSASWKIHQRGRAVADHATSAQCQLRVTSWPQIDGSVKLEFLPEIHFGDNLSRIGANGDDFAVRRKRQIKELHSLAFNVTIRPGETVVVAPTNQLERVGELFFGAKPVSVSSKSSSNANQKDADHVNSALAEDTLIEEFFPMIEKHQDGSDSSVLVQTDQIPDIELSGDRGRPDPWQRFVLVRVVDVTAAVGP